MLYKFSDIYRTNLYLENDVIFACGNYSLFNNIVVDKARNLVVKDIALNSVSQELLDEFVADAESRTNLSLKFDDFMDYVKSPSLFGKWLCTVQYDLMSKKQIERLINYCKKPNSNGLLVVTVSSVKNIINLRKNNIIKNSERIAYFPLSYPPREILTHIVIDLFKDRGYEIEHRSAEYFMTRLSGYYDEYTSTADRVIASIVGGKPGMQEKTDSGLVKIEHKDIQRSMRNIENFMFDDFIKRLVMPFNSGSRKIYKILDSLLDYESPYYLKRKLLRVIDNLILYRMAINKVYIPVTIRYSVSEAKEALGEHHKLYKVSDITFKKNAYIASKTSLKDWYFMKLILLNSGYDNLSSLRALLAVIARSVLSNDRLMNVTGIKDTLSEGLFDINAAYYKKYMNNDSELKAYEEIEKRREEAREIAAEKAEQKKRREVRKAEKEKAQKEELARRERFKALYDRVDDSKISEEYKNEFEIWAAEQLGIEDKVHVDLDSMTMEENEDD